jgi:UDPglucose 6-dehydrogenase
MAREQGTGARILNAVHETNCAQKQVLGEKVSAFFEGQLTDRRVALWGLAFKPRTDDIRDAPALDLIDCLLAGGARVRVFDPEAMDNVRARYGDQIEYAADPLEAATGADALAIVTEWGDFRQPDFEALKAVMTAPVIIDGRNLYDPAAMRERGFVYRCIGKLPVDGRSG